MPSSPSTTSDVIQEYNKTIRKDLDPTTSDKDPGNDAGREEELQLFRRKLEYQKVSNDKLSLQLQFFERFMIYLWLLVVIIALALPFPTYEEVTKKYVATLVGFCIMMYLVKNYYLLSFQVYFINLFHYIKSRFTGSVYHPYLVYGFIN